jgi:sugar fermentation stimulation protein A
MDQAIKIVKFNVPSEGSILLEIPGDTYSGVIVKRVNRFLVTVKVKEKLINCHLHDPGRLKELIFPGSIVNIRKTKGVKTSYSITSCFINKEEILLDTRFHNKIAENFIGESFKREVKEGDSRFDFSIENGFVEVKGCSMQYGDYVIFPDAPTLRGTKHLRGLSKLAQSNMDTNVIFLIFRKNVSKFYPNRVTDPLFSKVFFEAVDKGVNIYLPKMMLVDRTITFQGMCQIGRDPFI